MEVYKCINAVQAELCKIGLAKRSENASGLRFAFRSIDDIYNTVSPILAKCGLCILPKVTTVKTATLVGSKGQAVYQTILEVQHDFVAAADGSMHSVCTVGEAMDFNDKSANKAMAMAYKYAVVLAFGIPTEGDNDADASTIETLAPVSPEERYNDQAFAEKLTAWTLAVRSGKATAQNIADKASSIKALSHAQLQKILELQAQYRADVPAQPATAKEVTA